MITFLRTGLLTLTLLGAACATSSTHVRENLEAGRKAFEQGDVLRSYRLLRDPALTRQNLPPEYSALLKRVTEAAEYLIERWLEKGDFWLAQGDLTKALEYYRDVYEQLPPLDPFKAEVQQKTRNIDARIGTIQEEIGALLDAGQREFSAGNFELALQKLSEARWKAMEQNLTFAMRHQRMIEECKRRLPAPVDEVEDFQEQDVLSTEQSEETPRPSTPRRPAARQSKPAQKDEEEVYRSLLGQGNRYVVQKRYLEAILLYRRVLESYPEQPQAAEALQKLEPTRKRLVDEELRRAGEFFAKEDLQSAAPHYQRVLLLDPGNIRAKEGLQMYRRLKELKRGQK